MNSKMIWLIFLNFVIIAGGSMLMPLWVTFVGKIGGDVRTAGHAICIFSFIIGFFTIIIAKIESQLQAENQFLVISSLVNIIGFAGYFFVKSPGMLYIVQFIHAMGCAMQAPALFAIYQRHVKPRQEAFAWGVWAGSFNIAVGCGALMSAYLSHHQGIRWVIWAMFVFSLFAALISIFFVSLFGKEKRDSLIQNPF